MANLPLKKLGAAMVQADKRLAKEESGDSPTEILEVYRLDTDEQAPVPEMPQLGPEEFSMTERLIADLDARRAPGGERDSNENDVGEMLGDSSPTEKKVATRIINLVPSDPTRVTVTRAAKVMQVESKIGAEAPDTLDPLANNSSSLIEDFEADDEQTSVSETPEPWTNDLSNLVEDLEAEDEDLRVSNTPASQADDVAGRALSAESTGGMDQAHSEDRRDAGAVAGPEVPRRKVELEQPPTTTFSSAVSKNTAHTSRREVGEPGWTRPAEPKNQTGTPSAEPARDQKPFIAGPDDEARVGSTRLQSDVTTEQNNPTSQDRGPAVKFGDVGQDHGSPENVHASKTVPIQHLHPNRLQPRRRFDEEGIRALADSIKENGMLQPILVRRYLDRTGEFEIVTGERRCRAAKLAQLHEVPIVIREISDCKALEFALVENIQRQDLTPLETAEGYRRLIEEFNYTQEDLSRVVCKSRSHISNTVRLLNLPPVVKEMLQQGELNAGHARALLNAKRPEELARQVIAKGLSVRETESFTQKAEADGRVRHTAKPAKRSEIAALERDLSTLLDLKVTISTRRHGGSLMIHFTCREQLEEIVRRLTPVGSPLEKRLTAR